MKKKPHILLITTDEQHRDTLYPPAGFYELPGIQSLKECATDYTSAYSSSPVCLPARCTFMTGLYPFHSKCISNHMGATLPQSLPNLFTCLKQAGYHTSLHGKCHFIPVPYAAVRNDCTQEYEHFIAYYRSLGMDHLDLQDDKNNSLWYYDDFAKELEAKGELSLYRETYHREMLPMMLPEFPLPMQDHPDAWVGQKALDWIGKQDSNTPQFTWVSFSGPHYPMDVPQEWYSKIHMEAAPPRVFSPGEWDDRTKLHRNGYFGPGTTEGSDNAPGGAQRVFSAEYWETWRKKYYANIVQIDSYVQKIIALARKQYGENLMILFTSDHGDMMGNHGLWGKNHSLYEDVIRIPLLVCYPGQKAPKIREQLVSSVDIFPTILQQAGCEKTLCDGEPLEAVAEEGGRKVIVSCCENRVAVIWNGIKLCRNIYEKTGELYTELYDLNQDPHEFQNLAQDPAYQPQLQALQNLLLEMEKRDGVISTVFPRENKGKPFWYRPYDGEKETASTGSTDFVGQEGI